MYNKNDNNDHDNNNNNNNNDNDNDNDNNNNTISAILTKLECRPFVECVVQEMRLYLV